MTLIEYITVLLNSMRKGIKSFQDTNVVHVLLYFTKLFVFRKFPIAEVSLTLKIQQTMTLY